MGVRFLGDSIFHRPCLHDFIAPLLGLELSTALPQKYLATTPVGMNPRGVIVASSFASYMTFTPSLLLLGLRVLTPWVRGLDSPVSHSVFGLNVNPLIPRDGGRGRSIQPLDPKSDFRDPTTGVPVWRVGRILFCGVDD